MRPQHLLTLLFLTLFLTACAAAPAPTAAPTPAQATALPPTATPTPTATSAPTATATPTATPTPAPTYTPTTIPTPTTQEQFDQIQEKIAVVGELDLNTLSPTEQLQVVEWHTSFVEEIGDVGTNKPGFGLTLTRDPAGKIHAICKAIYLDGANSRERLLYSGPDTELMEPADTDWMEPMIEYDYHLHPEYGLVFAQLADTTGSDQLTPMNPRLIWANGEWRLNHEGPITQRWGIRWEIVNHQLDAKPEPMDEADAKLLQELYLEIVRLATEDQGVIAILQEYGLPTGERLLLTDPAFIFQTDSDPDIYMVSGSGNTVYNMQPVIAWPNFSQGAMFNERAARHNMTMLKSKENNTVPMPGSQSDPLSDALNDKINQHLGF